MYGGRRAQGEGAGLGGRQTRSRNDKVTPQVASTMQERFARREGQMRAEDVQEKTMQAGHEPNFRERSEIAEMRDRAAKYKAHPPVETLEMAAARIRKRRG